MATLKSHFLLIEQTGASPVYLPTTSSLKNAICKYLPVTLLKRIGTDKPLPFVDASDDKTPINFTPGYDLGLAPVDSGGSFYLLERKDTSSDWVIVAVTLRDVKTSTSAEIRCHPLGRNCHPGEEKGQHRREARADLLSLQIMHGLLQQERTLSMSAADQLAKTVRDANFKTVQRLISIIKTHGKLMQRRCPTEYMVANVTLRVLHTVRQSWFKIYAKRGEEQRREAKLTQGFTGADAFFNDAVTGSGNTTPTNSGILPSTSVSPTPLSTLSLSSPSSSTSSFFNSEGQAGSRVFRVSERTTTSGVRSIFDEKLTEAEIKMLKGDVDTFIEDLGGELEGAVANMAVQASEYVRPGDCFLIHGYSKAVFEFLTAAWSKKCHFEVFVAQDVPECSGERMVKELVEAGIPATLISDASVYAIMPRATKVISGVRAILADGGAIARAGIKVMALAAKKHGKPFLVCSSIVKLTPFFPYDMERVSSLSNPGALLHHSDFNSFDKVQVVNPKYDYIPPDLISLLITDGGSYSTSFIYRLLNNYYDPEDYQYDTSLCPFI